ncbi:IS3 family transposase [Vibrio vulnificus]
MGLICFENELRIKAFINHQSVVAEAERYIRFYNYKRRHSSIGHLTPHEMYQKKQKAA